MPERRYMLTASPLTADLFASATLANPRLR